MRAETIGRRQDGSRIDGVNSGDRIVARATLLAFLRFRKGFDSLAILNYQFGWLRGLQKLLKGRNFWLRGVDLNHRPLGYEPNELPGCSTPQKNHISGVGQGQTGCGTIVEAAG